MRASDELSVEAIAIVEMIGHTGSISDVMSKHPELAVGLDEYQKWRDQKHHDDGYQADFAKKESIMGHSITKFIKKSNM